MKWRAVTYGTGKSVGSNYEFNPQQDSLKPTQEGHYFMYVNLNLTCVYDCTGGVLSVQVGNELTCDVELPEVANSTPVTKKCWTVSRLKTEGLISQMTIPEKGLKNWSLDLNSSGFGMFLVDWCGHWSVATVAGVSIQDADLPMSYGVAPKNNTRVCFFLKSKLVKMGHFQSFKENSHRLKNVRRWSSADA